MGTSWALENVAYIERMVGAKISCFTMKSLTRTFSVLQQADLTSTSCVQYPGFRCLGVRYPHNIVKSVKVRYV